MTLTSRVRDIIWAYTGEHDRLIMMTDWCRKHDLSYTYAIYIDGLVQKRRNSSALAMGYVFIVFNHQYIIFVSRCQTHWAYDKWLTNRHPCEISYKMFNFEEYTIMYVSYLGQLICQSWKQRGWPNVGPTSMAVWGEVYPQVYFSPFQYDLVTIQIYSNGII